MKAHEERFSRVLHTRIKGKRYLGVADVDSLKYLQNSRERAQQFFDGGLGARTTARAEIFKEVLDLTWGERDVLDLFLALFYSSNSLGVIAEQESCWQKIDTLRGKCKSRKFRDGLHGLRDRGFIGVNLLPTGTRHFNKKADRWGTNQVCQVTWTPKFFALTAKAPNIAEVAADPPSVSITAIGAKSPESPMPVAGGSGRLDLSKPNESSTVAHISTLRQKTPPMVRKEPNYQQSSKRFADSLSLDQTKRPIEKRNTCRETITGNHEDKSTRPDPPATGIGDSGDFAPIAVIETEGGSDPRTCSVDPKRLERALALRRRPLSLCEPRTYADGRRMILQDLWSALRPQAARDQLYKFADSQTSQDYPAGYPSCLDWADLIFRWPSLRRRERLDLLSGQIIPALLALQGMIAAESSRKKRNPDRAPPPIIEIDPADLAKLRGKYWLAASAVRQAARGGKPPRGQVAKDVKRCIEVFGQFKF